MSDERDTFDGAVKAMLAPQALRVLHDAVVVDQSGATIGVKLTSQEAPSETAKPVPVWFGLPGFAAKFNANAETKIGFVGGREDGAFASLFPYYPQGVSETPAPLPIEYLSFGGGTQAVARKGDVTSSGALLFTQTPVGPGGIPSTLTISYRDYGGTVTPVLTMPLPGPVVPNPALVDPLDPMTVVLELPGRITTGREEFRA